MVVDVGFLCDVGYSSATVGGISDTYWTGSSYSAIGAAFQTVGLYLQADILDAFSNSNFGNLAPLIYACAALVGLVQMVTGAPPRNYMWFFLGPPIFLWLTTTLEPVHGTPWQVGPADNLTGVPGQFESDQQRMWQLAEAGLANLAVVGNEHIEVNGTSPPNRAALVSSPFVWWNELTSSVVERLVAMFAPGHAWATGKPDSNLGALPPGDVRQFEEKWQLIGPTKWDLVANLTEVRFQNPDARDVLTYFLSSECGEKLTLAVKKGRLAQAATSRGTGLPSSVFKYRNGYGDLHKLLDMAWVPMPHALPSLFREAPDDPAVVGCTDDPIGVFSCDSFGYFWEKTSPGGIRRVLGAGGPARNVVQCTDLFEIVVSLFRWEAGNAYAQLIRTGPVRSERNGSQRFTENEILYAIYYGWGVRAGDPYTRDADRSAVAPLSLAELRYFTHSLMTMFIMKNELRIAPQIADVRYAASQNAVRWAEAQQTSTGSFSKFGELWTWAMMIPYLQALLFYFLAAMFPFAALVTIIPGMMKSMATWMSFWLWAKLWDVGFAICVSVDRAIWASLGNNSNTEEAFDWILTLTNTAGLGPAKRVNGKIEVTCTANGAAVAEPLEACPSDSVWIRPAEGWNDPSFRRGGRFHDLAWFFDAGLMTSNNLSFDTNNAFYIYIMSALYFAVPAVTGQLVLLGKQGISGVITSGLERQSQQAGSGAQSGFTGDLGAKVNQASLMASQASYERGLRHPEGFAARAIAASNSQIDEGNKGHLATLNSQGVGAVMSARGNKFQRQQADTAFRGRVVSAAGTLAMLADRKGEDPAEKLKKGAAGGTSNEPSLYSKIVTAGREFADLGLAGENFRLTAEQTRLQTGSERERFGLSADAAKHQAASSLHGASAQRGMEAANYQAQNRQGDSMRNNQLANAGVLAAMGQSSSYNYQRPTGMVMGAAMCGMLGKEAAKNAAQPWDAEHVGNTLKGFEDSKSTFASGDGRILRAGGQRGGAWFAPDTLTVAPIGPQHNDPALHGAVAAGTVIASSSATSLVAGPIANGSKWGVVGLFGAAAGGTVLADVTGGTEILKKLGVGTGSSTQDTVGIVSGFRTGDSLMPPPPRKQE